MGVIIVVTRVGLIVTRFGAKSRHDIVFKLEDLDKLNLPIDLYIFAANAIRDWASFIMVEYNPKTLKAQANKASIVINEKTRSIVQINKDKIMDM
jgi:hypothetical protein